MTKIILYYGFDPDDTTYQYAKVSIFEDKETENLPVEISRYLHCGPRHNKGLFFNIAKYLKSLERNSNKDYKYYFKITPDFFKWTKAFKEYFKTLNIQIIFKYSKTFGERFISDWRKKQLKD